MSTTLDSVKINEILQPPEDTSSLVEFNVAKFLSGQSNSSDIEQDGDSTLMENAVVSFKEICKIVQDDLKNMIQEKESEDGKDGSLLDLQHKAMIGNTEAKSIYLAKIEEVLRKRNIVTFNYPEFFGSLGNAIFHEVWGWSLLEKWYSDYPDSEECMIIGRELWIDINGQTVRQEERFLDDDVVERIKRVFVSRSQFSVINAQTPQLEIEHEDGSRISMIQQPRGRLNYIVIRRFIVNRLNLEEQARRKTIPYKDIKLYRALSRTLPNIIVAGQIRSAKSTFMKTLIGERDDTYRIASLEKHFELDLKRAFPDRAIYELQSTEGELHTAVPALLRMPHEFIVIGEIRSKEMEGFMWACERGERGAFGTYHLTFAEEAVPQLTRHLLDEYPNRTYEIEAERVAKNLDIIISMAVDHEKNIKRVEGVTEVVWDEEKRVAKTKPLVKYDRLTERYFYSSDISSRLFYLMKDKNKEEASNLLSILKEREKESPMSEFYNMYKEIESGE